MGKPELFSSYYELVKRNHLHPSKTRLSLYISYLFQDMSFDGKTMLDIGGGNGLFSLYGACMGAKLVICLEPELEGAANGVALRLKQLCDNLTQRSIIPKAVTLQDFDPAGQTFDIILLHNSINHLDEEACVNLQTTDEARARYKAIFRKLSEIAAPSAKLIICDCSRYNLFGLLGVRNPFISDIEWHKHQSPEFWSSMLHEFGFRNPRIRWLYFGHFPIMSRLPLYNRLASYAAYFTASHFCLTMDKAEIPEISRERDLV
jgi:hypothetical protein